MAKLTAEQRIEKVHVALMRNPKFCLFSGMFMVGKVSVDDKVPTARTDGVNVEYGREFVDRLNDKQLGFLILHEAMHKAYRHLTTWEKLYKKNRHVANVACDYVINLQIRDYDPEGDFVEMPTDEEGNVMGCIDERFRGMDAGQVFGILEKELPPPPPRGRPCDNGSNDGEGDPNKPVSHGNVQQGFDEHDWENANSMDPKEAEEMAKEIDNALRQGALLAGKMNGKVSRDIQELLTPKIDWREVLRDFVKTVAQGRDDTSWRRYNKRLIGSGVYIPVPISQKLGSVALGVDTSGSVGGEILAQFLGEVKSICDEVSPDVVDLIYWDSRVASHEKYEGHMVHGLTDSTKPRGGGGTSPECVPRYLGKENIKPDCVVMLTDGYFYGDEEGDWSNVGAPVLWCVIDNKHFTAKNGVTVHI